MRMRSSFACIFLTGLLLGGSPLLAQEPEDVADDETGESTPSEDTEGEPSKTQFWGLQASVQYWIVQPVGADYPVALQYDADDLGATAWLRSVRFGTDNSYRWRVGYDLGEDRGDIVVTYWSYAVDQELAEFRPGSFVFGELLAFPVEAGIFETGRADAFIAETRTATRDFRLSFYRDATRGERVVARWFAGLRFTDHAQAVDVAYWALLPGEIAPGVYPVGERAPEPDLVATRSNFSGRGIEAGLEGRFAIAPKLAFEFGASAALLRGTVDASYRSQTVFYDEQFVQQPLVVGVDERGSSLSALVWEANLGLRWNAWKGLDVTAGIRQSRYENVARELRIRDIAETPTAPPWFSDVDRTDKGIGYEGYYVGVGYRY